MSFKPQCLLIIDMQAAPNAPLDDWWHGWGFKSALNKRTVRHCIALIKQAIANEIQIVVMEYLTCGATHPEITKAIGNYEKVKILGKHRNDGSHTFDHYPELKVLKNIRVCGVNSDACVNATVCGLIEKGHDIQVAPKACNSDTLPTIEANVGFWKRNKKFGQTIELFLDYRVSA